jgi:hypothetical protein
MQQFTHCKSVNSRFRRDLFSIFPLTIPIKKRDIVVITKESSFSENKISEMWCGVPLYLIE